MKEKIRYEICSCEICGHPVVNYESGVCMRCEKCGWQGGGDNIEFEQQWGISYPMLVSLSHAKEQYKQGLPFKADFDEFIRELFFYSEMLFDYKQTTYEVFLKGDEESDMIVFCCTDFQQEYFSEKDLREKVNINGDLLKDIWDEVQHPRFM